MNRTTLALIAGAAALALGLWLLVGQRPFDGPLRAEVHAAPELPEGPAGAAIDPGDLIRGFESLGVFSPDTLGVQTQRERYTRALLERFPEPSHREITPEIVLAGWGAGASETGGSRLALVFYAKARPTRDLIVYVHSLGDEKTLPLFPEYRRISGFMAASAPPPRPLTAMEPGSFLVVPVDLPYFDTELPVRIGLMDERADGVGSPVELGGLWHGAPKPKPSPRAQPARFDLRRANTVLASREVSLTPGRTSIVLAGTSSEGGQWDRVVLSADTPAAGALFVRLMLSDDFSRAGAEGRLVPGESLTLTRAGTEFSRPIRRWRAWSVAGAMALGVMVFLAFRPSHLGRLLRFAFVAVAVGAALRLFKAESVLDRTQWWMVLASDVLIAGVGTWLLSAVGRAVGIVDRPRDPAPLDLRSRWRSFAVLLVCFAAPLLTWFIGEWPGHPYYDECAMFNNALRFEAHPWLSTFYSVYVVSILRLCGHFTAVCVVNIAILSWALADLFSLLLALGARRWVVAVFSILIATSIPLGLMAGNMTHDITTAVLKIALVVVVLKVFVRAALLGAPGATGAALAAIGALVFLISSLRNENIVLLAFVPFALLITRQARWPAVLALVAALAAGTALYRVMAKPRLDGPKVFATDTYNRYTLYLLTGPVGFMVKHTYFTATPDEDRRAIADAIDYEKFVAQYDPFTLNYTWGNVPEVTDERLRNFKRVYVTSALNNPSLFLANRALVLFRCIEGNPKNWYSVRFGRETLADSQLYPAEFLGLLAAHGMTFERESPGLPARLTHRLRDWSRPGGYGTPGYYIWNAIPALGLTLIGLSLFRRLPMTATLCGLIAAPLVLFTLGAPAAMFKYITDLYIFGFLVVPIALLELGPLRRVRERRPP